MFLSLLVLFHTRFVIQNLSTYLFSKEANVFRIYGNIRDKGTSRNCQYKMRKEKFYEFEFKVKYLQMKGLHESLGFLNLEDRKVSFKFLNNNVIERKQSKLPMQDVENL